MPKMVMLFLLIGLLPMLISSVISFVLANQALTADMEAQIKLFHDQQQTILENWFANQKVVAETAAATRDVYESLNYYVDSQWVTQSEIAQWENRNRGVLTPFIERLITQYDFAFISVTDRNGKVISSTDSRRLNDDLSERDYFRKAINGQINISEIFYSDITSEYCLVIATPVYSNGTSGTVTGVMIFFLNIPQISETLMGGLVSVGNTADAYLIDANQTLLTVPRFSQGMEVLKTRIDTEAAAEAARAAAVGNTSFNHTFIYENMRGKKVIGNASTFMLGDQLVGFNIEVDYDEAFAEINQLKKIAVVLAIIISAVVAVIGIIFARSITTPFLRINEQLKLLDTGDFTVEFPADRQDEIGEMGVQLNITVKDLREVITSVVHSAQSVQSASAQIATGNQDLSQRTQEQASALEEISSTMEEMATSIQQVSNNTDQANQVAQITLEAVNEGDQSIQETIEAMEEISTSSKQIAEIIQVVNDIAFQTNLLALNAAVEAARAGEQGRGFAVVAAEVRNLAGRTAESAKEIEDLINESVRRVERGNEMTQKSSEMLKRIVENTKKTSDVILEVASAMREQSSAAEQIQSSIEQLNQVTQENAAMVEEISATSQALDVEAENLRNNVAQFKVEDSDRNTVETTTSPKGNLGKETAVWSDKTETDQENVFNHDSLVGF